MSDDWETAADDIAPSHVVAKSNQWDGEDEEEASAPDAWDAEPEDAPKPKVALIVTEKKSVLTKKALAKKEEEESKLADKMAAAQVVDTRGDRERLKALEEARDAALAGDLFGITPTLRPKNATSDLPGAASVAAASSKSSVAAATSTVATPASSSSSSSASSSSNASLKSGARIDESVLDTDADVDRFVADLGRRLEKLGKSVLASKKICKLIAGITEESIKLGVLRLDEVAELKRIVTVNHNAMTTKQKAGGKKPVKVAAKPAVALNRNAFMHGDLGQSFDDGGDDDGDFI